MDQPSARITLLEPYAERLRVAAIEVLTTRQAYEDAVALRDEIVVEAMDGGASYAEVARYGQLSPARVVQIVAKAG